MVCSFAVCVAVYCNRDACTSAHSTALLWSGCDTTGKCRLYILNKRREWRFWRQRSAHPRYEIHFKGKYIRMYGAVRRRGFPERRCGEDNTCHCRLPRIQLLICSSCLPLERGYSSISHWQREWLSFLHTILILPSWSTNYLLSVCLINLTVPL